MAKLDQAKEQLITKIDELFGFNLSNKQDGVSYDFWQYRLNKLYKPLVKYFIEQFLTHLEGYTPQEAEKVLGLFSDFFSLYYSNGDFGYFKNKFSTYQYRIPYSGKDTEFWRATKDCYYVKTSDVVNDMAVSLGGMFDGKEISLKLFKKTESTTTESWEEKYVFDIQIEEIIDEESGEMTGYKITFINREESSDRRTTKEAKIKEFLQDQWIDYNTPGIKKTIDEFLKKRGRDYFIHKRLKAFLTEELERYFFQMLKTDLQAKADILSIQTKIEEIKAKYSDDPSVIDFKIGQLIKESQGDIQLSLYETAYLWILNYINILADLEEFKAKLWNKKRKIIKQEYCITIGKILEYEYLIPRKNEMLQEIVQNKAQLKEREELLEAWHKHLEKITLDWVIWELTSGMVNMATNMVVDTKHFDKSSKLYQTLHERWQKKLYEDGAKLDWILIKSENYQGLNVLLDDYKNQIKTTYIDPPYNTWGDWFPYKDDYMSSSWIWMMKERLLLSKFLMKDKWVQAISIWDAKDNTEQHRLKLVLEEFFGKENIDTVIWKKVSWDLTENSKRVSRIKWIHEYIEFAYEDKEKTLFDKMMKLPNWKNIYWNKDNDERWWWKWWRPWLPEDKSNKESENYYTIPNDLNQDVIKVFKEKFGKEFKISHTKERFFSKNEFENLLLDNKVYLPKDGYGTPEIKKFQNQKHPSFFDSILEWFWSLSTAKKLELESMFWESDIINKLTPKPSWLIAEIIRSTKETDYDIILDYFSGTWTTWIATIWLNKESNLNLKFISLEMWSFFDDILLKRYKNYLFSNKRENRMPVWEWVSWYFSYIYLNQYEDWFNSGWYLDSIEWDINQLNNTDLEQVSDIKQILFPLSQLKEKIYWLDDVLVHKDL